MDIPLLPQTAAELSGAELLAMAAGVGDAEWEAEADAWITARGTGPAARELLELAAEADPGERMLAVAAATRIGAAGRARLAREPGRAPGPRPTPRWPWPSWSGLTPTATCRPSWR